MNYAKTLRRHVYHPGTFSISSSTGEVKLERSLDVTVSRRYVLEAQVTDGLHLAQVSSVPETLGAHTWKQEGISVECQPAAFQMVYVCVCVCVCVCVSVFVEGLYLYADIIIWEGEERAKQVPLW